MSAIPVFFWLDMTDADDIKDQVAADAESGVQTFSDGTNQVSMAPLKDRLEVAEKLTRATVAANNPSFGLRNTQLRSPAGGFR